MITDAQSHLKKKTDEADKRVSSKEILLQVAFFLLLKTK